MAGSGFLFKMDFMAAALIAMSCCVVNALLLYSDEIRNSATAQACCVATKAAATLAF